METNTQLITHARFHQYWWFSSTAVHPPRHPLYIVLRYATSIHSRIYVYMCSVYTWLVSLLSFILICYYPDCSFLSPPAGVYKQWNGLVEYWNGGLATNEHFEYDFEIITVILFVWVGSSIHSISYGHIVPTVKLLVGSFLDRILLIGTNLSVLKRSSSQLPE